MGKYWPFSKHRQATDSSSRTDLLIAVLFVVSFYGISSWLGWHRHWAEWIDTLYVSGLESLPPALVAAVTAFAWFAWRRWREGARSTRLWAEVSRHLETEIEKRAALQRSEQEIRRKLEQAFHIQHRRTERLTRVREMSDLVLSSDHSDEIHRIVSKYLPQVLPFSTGAFYTASPSSGFWRATTTWGGFDRAGDAGFETADCWALRRGKPYDDTHCGESLCSHVSDKGCGKVLCIPVACRGETFGVIHFRDEQAPKIELDDDSDARIEDRELATTIGETLGLHLFNLSLREELSRESTRDPLTGIFNRRGLLDAIEGELASQYSPGFRLAVLIVDADHFKRVNDMHGHDAGDAVLQALAQLISARIRDRDLLARWGGEEFLIALPDTDLSTAMLRAEQIRRAVEKLEIRHDGKNLDGITVSIGLAAFPDHTRNWEQLIKVADQALYDAKGDGRNRVIAGNRSKTLKDNTIPFERVK